MRLSDREKEIIRSAAREAFGSSARVLVFGSRLDDSARGGDLDLLVQCRGPLKDSGLRAARFSALIQLQTGLRKIDVLAAWPGAGLSPAHEAALSEGVEIS
jgi:uncharacterized protein